MSNAHAIRFVRALAIGVAAGSIAVAACTPASNSESNNSNANASGNESAAQSTDAGASGSIAAGEHATHNEPCALVGQVASTASRPPLMCTCTARDAGSPTWECSSMGEIVVGPLPPPEMPG